VARDSQQGNISGFQATVPQSHTTPTDDVWRRSTKKEDSRDALRLRLRLRSLHYYLFKESSDIS
jgi:hypothetical protein